MAGVQSRDLYMAHLSLTDFSAPLGLAGLTPVEMTVPYWSLEFILDPEF